MSWLANIESRARTASTFCDSMATEPISTP
jgi:hypothetical protein